MVKNKILKRIVAGLSCIALSTTMLTSLPAFADDYVDEYQYYSTLDPNSEEYQEWKSNLASSTVSVPQNRMLKSILKNNTLIANDYIEFNTASNGHYTIGTTGGNPNSSTDDNKKMLFGHPGGGTSKTTIVVGESRNEFTSSNVTYDADGSKSVSKASYDGVDVTQELSIIENSATGRDDVVQIKYIVKNDTEYEKQVGIRIMMDTMLGSNDAAPFRVNGSDVTTETEYTGSNIPQIWQAFDSATNPGVVAQGTFYKSGDRKPDKVQFTNWGNVTSTLWDYVTQPGRSNGDSAVSITWDTDTFSSGETREFVTYYGLSELEQDLVPPIALSVYADNTLEYGNGQYGNANLSIYLDNISDVNVNNVVLSISTPTYLEKVTGSNSPVTYTMMSSGSHKALNLSYRLKQSVIVPDDLEDEIKITLTYPLDAENNEVKEITKKIKIPKIDKAIVIVPGIMGSQLFRQNGDRCWEPFWIEEISNFSSGDGDSLLDAIVNQTVFYEEVIRSIDDLYYLSCDKDGKSDDPINLGTQFYGTMDVYEKLYNKLNETQFNESTDVIFYAYDWRLDINSQLSDLYNKVKDYDDINFVAHSMGGLLVDGYVNNYDTSKISKVVTLGTPFGGAPLAGKVLLSGDLSDVLGNDKLGYAGPFVQGLANNFTSIYELLPNEDYIYTNSWLNRRSIAYTGEWWEFWKTESIDEPLNYSETNSIIGDVCNNKLLNKAIAFQNSLDDNAYNGIETIAFIGNSNADTFASMSCAYTSEGFFTMPSYDNSTTTGDSIVPLISAKQRFKDYKVYGNNHMGLATNDQVLEDVVTFLKNGKSSLQGGYITQAKARKLLASTTPSYNYQLAFRGNMNMSAVGDDSEYNLILSKVNDSWFGIYDNSEEFRIDRMGNLNNQEMYICTYSNNKYTYTFESLEDQTVDFVFSNGEDSFVVAGIMVSEGTIVSVNTQNKTVTVDDTTYRFRNINPITLDENDISLKSKNVYNDTITDTIAARIKLTNLSDKEIDINDLEIVYLYDNDENTNEIFECDWAGLDNVTINSSVISNISYDEDLECSKITLSFNQVENSILPENADLDVHFRVHTISWDNYDITNDYSLNGRDYSENDRILVYYNGVLVSGNVE